MWKINPPKSWCDMDFWTPVVFATLEGAGIGLVIGLVILLVMALAT